MGSTSLGRVPYYPGQTDRTVAGPIARTVRDAALMMNVIARPDGRDWMELPRDDTDYVAALGGDLTGLRVALSPTFGFQRVAPVVLGAFETAAGRLAALGAEVTPVESVGFDAFDIYMIQATLRLRETLAALAPEERNRLPAAVTSVLRFAAGISAADIQRMIDRRSQLSDELLPLFQKHDVIVSPAAPTPAPPIGQFYPDADAFSADGRNLIGFACPFNLVHMPAVSIPWDLSPEGLPIGLQIAGPKFSDALLLRVADLLAVEAPLNVSQVVAR
jgi:aspartyl-tRNA(Asn)/glutamyl-tRNA(Gln) amidotransferase subunit A